MTRCKHDGPFKTLLSPHKFHPIKWALMGGAEREREYGLLSTYLRTIWIKAVSSGTACGGTHAKSRCISSTSVSQLSEGGVAKFLLGIFTKKTTNFVDLGNILSCWCMIGSMIIILQTACQHLYLNPKTFLKILVAPERRLTDMGSQMGNFEAF